MTRPVACPMMFRYDSMLHSRSTVLVSFGCLRISGYGVVDGSLTDIWEGAAT